MSSTDAIALIDLDDTVARYSAAMLDEMEHLRTSSTSRCTDSRTKRS